MVTNPIPEDQRYIVFPIEDPDTGRIDAHGWEWMDNGRDDPIWNDWTPGWEPLICELVPVAEADRLRAIETAAVGYLEAHDAYIVAKRRSREAPAALRRLHDSMATLAALLAGGQS